MLEVGGRGHAAKAAVERRVARKKIFAFIFQLSGWALVAPPCFVPMY